MTGRTIFERPSLESFMATQAIRSRIAPLAQAFTKTVLYFVLPFATAFVVSETAGSQEPAKQVVVASTQQTPKQPVPAPAFFHSHDPM